MDDRGNLTKDFSSIVYDGKNQVKESPFHCSVSLSSLSAFLSNSSITDSDSQLTEDPISYDETWNTSNHVLDSLNDEKPHEDSLRENNSVLTKPYEQDHIDSSEKNTQNSNKNSFEESQISSRFSSQEISELEQKEMKVLCMKHSPKNEENDQYDHFYDDSSMQEGLEFEKSGNFHEAKDRYLDTLLIQKKIILSYQLDLEMINSFRRLAYVNCKLNEKQLAIKHFKEAIRIYEQHEQDLNGNFKEWEEYTRTLYDLALIYSKMNKPKQAIFLHEKAIDVLLDYKGDTNHNIYPKICYHIGFAYEKIKMRHEAYMYHFKELVFYRENYTDIEKINKALKKSPRNLLEKKSNEEKFRIFNRLCILFGKKKEYKEALHCCDFTHKIFSDGARVSMEDIILSHINSGNVFSAFDKIDDAIESYTRAIEISNKTNESTTIQNGLGRSEILFNIAILYWKQGSLEDAGEYFKKFLDSSDLIRIKDAELDSQYRSILEKKTIALHNLGNILCKMGEHESGIDFYEESLKFKCFLYGQNSDETVETKYDLGRAYFDTRKFDSAQLMFKNILLGEGKNKPQGLDKANLLFKLGKVDMAKKEFSDAITKFKESLNLKQEILDEDDCSIFKTLYRIALAESYSGNNEQAIPILVDVKKHYRSKLRDSHPLHAKISLDMAKIYLHINDISKAEENCMNAIKGFELAQVPHHHPHAIQSLGMLQKIRAKKESMHHSNMEEIGNCEIILV